MGWDEIEAAVASQDHQGALALALEAWRGARHAPLAALVDALSDRVPPVGQLGRTRKELFHLAWMRLASAADPRDLGLLFGSLRRSLPTTSHTEMNWLGNEWQIDADFGKQKYWAWLDRIDALTARPDDPRLAAPLVSVVREAPMAASSGPILADIYGSTLALIARIGDERALEPLRSLLEVPVARTGPVREYLAGALPQLISELEGAARRRPPLGSADLERCRRVAARLRGPAGRPAPRQTLEDLMSMILADPDDDGARQVYSDALLERGDPRGELIALQFKQERGEASDADERQMRLLLRRHEGTWLGQLRLLLHNRVYRRGFLEQAQLARNAVADARLWELSATDPRLATVRVLEKGNSNEDHYRSFVLSPAMRGLRQVTVLSEAMLDEICRAGEPWRFTHLVLARQLKQNTVALLSATRALPSLRELSVPAPRRTRALIALLAGWQRRERLEAITLRVGFRSEPPAEELAAWLAAGETLGVARLAVDKHDFRVSALIGEQGRTVEVELVSDGQLAPLLGQLGVVSRLVLRRAPGQEPGQLDAPQEIGLALLQLAPAAVEMPAAWEAQIALK